MFKKINDFLAGWPMTIVGGLFLLASFILPRVGYPEGEKLAWVCVIICGIPLLYLSVWRIIHNRSIAKISSALLISIAMIAAILIGDLFAAGEVAFIMEIGALLEDMTTERAKKGLKNLIALAPETGRVIANGQESVVPVDQIRVGDTVRVLPGVTIPVDGVIRIGETSVDQSVMTGESLPVDKAVSDSVFSGTINRFGAIDVEVTKVSGDSALQKLIRMVGDAENHQAPTQRIADRCASWLVPIALTIAILAWLITGDIVRGVTVMVVFCPCALVLATPTAIMAAIGQATKHGVIIKSGEALERMGSVDTIAFDKTGTLTYGRLEVSDILPMTDMTPDALLTLAASAERLSEHPLGRAIAERAKDRPLLPVSEFKMSAGKGIWATVDGKSYRLGNEKYIAEAGIRLDGNARAALDRLRGEGKASVIVADEAMVIGIIALSDVLRPEATDMIKRLAAMNTRAVLLTGDHDTATRFLASKVGIEDVRADLLPEEKVGIVNELKRAGRVCMIGDGVNDAPALKTADVGVAMGAMGSDIAVDAADVALMTDDISKLPYLKWLSNATVKTIRTAITLSMCINFTAVTLSVLGVLNPTTGALVHNAGSCFVVLLAALLYDGNNSGSLEDTEWAAIKAETVVDLSEAPNKDIIRDLEGIRNFERLQTLNVSGCSNLTRLWYWAGYYLTNLNIRGCTSLTVLNCSENQVSDLFLDDCIKLESLYCNGNQLKSLDVSKLTALKNLNCEANSISELNVSNNPELSVLSCGFNWLSELKIDNNTKLHNLQVYENPLSTLDISNCPELNKCVYYGKSWTEPGTEEAIQWYSFEYPDDYPSFLGLDKSRTLTSVKPADPEPDPDPAPAPAPAPAVVAPAPAPAPATEPITISKTPASTKAKAKKGKVTVTWKKIKKSKKTKALLGQIKSIQVQYSTDPNFATDVNTKTVSKKKTKATLSLQRKTTYYIRVRYVGSDGVSNWGAVKAVKTK